MVQFAELQVQKTKFDDGQKVLITSRDECQAKIDAFEEKRRAISVTVPPHLDIPDNADFRTSTGKSRGSRCCSS